jgi:hypothetical protein
MAVLNQVTYPESPEGDVSWDGVPGWIGSAHPMYRHFALSELPWADYTNTRQNGNSIQCVKLSRSRQVLRIESSSDFGAETGEPVYAKRYLINTTRRKIGNLLSGGKARREYELGHRLIQLGFLTPVPLSWAIALPQRIIEPQNQPPGYAQAASFLLTRALDHAGDLFHWARQGTAEASPFFFPSFAVFLARMHEIGFYHDDCSGRNIFVASGAKFDAVPPPENLLKTFAVLDVDHGRLYPRAIPLHRRAVNLYQLLRSLRKAGLKSNTVRMQFLKDYIRYSGLDPEIHTRKLRGMINRIAHRKLGEKLIRK